MRAATARLTSIGDKATPATMRPRHTPVMVVVALAAAAGATPAWALQTTPADAPRPIGAVPDPRAPRPGVITRQFVLPGSGTQATRREHLVIVRGFRFQSTVHELRTKSLREGYGLVAGRAECRTSACAFVVMPSDAAVGTDTTWRHTNVLAAPEQELVAMAEELAAAGATLVIVHPPGNRLKPPYIN
jgi:hypothetical protein